jgi:DMSO reductase family type II enzyme chaperone
MSDEVLERLSGPQERLAAMRSLAYQTFVRAFAYPGTQLAEAIGSGALAGELREILTAVDPSLVERADWEALRDAGRTEEDLAVEFTRLFDVGAGGPPCPLYGGLYSGARMKTMEEVVRFYNHFGLTLAEAPRELPDHLTTELEFLHYLTYREAEVLQAGGDPGPWRRAQRDFVARHPGRWVPKLRARLEAQTPMRFFQELVRCLEDFLESESAHLVLLAGAARTAPDAPTPEPDAGESANG